LTSTPGAFCRPSGGDNIKDVSGTDSIFAQMKTAVPGIWERLFCLRTDGKWMRTVFWFERDRSRGVLSMVRKRTGQFPRKLSKFIKTETRQTGSRSIPRKKPAFIITKAGFLLFIEGTEAVFR